MSPELFTYALAGLTVIVTATMVVGLPSIALIAIKFFKFKEREVAMELEYRQKSQHKDLALEARVQRLEDALTSLDHDVRVRLGIEKPAAPLSSHAELLEGPGAPEARGAETTDRARGETGRGR